MPYGNQLINNYFRRMAILKIFTLLREVDKEMEILIQAIFLLLKRIFLFLTLYFFVLAIISIFPLRILINQEPFGKCSGLSNGNSDRLSMNRQ